MKQYKIKKENLSGFLSAILDSESELYAPSKQKEGAAFIRVEKFEDISLNAKQTLISPKSAIFPKCEELLSYKKNGAEILIKPDAGNIKETVIFGVRPCDAIGLSYMKEFFTEENADFHVAKRFDKTTIISLSCNSADGYCFCTSVGNNPGSLDGSDINLTETPDGTMITEAVTDKGMALIEKYTAFFSECENIDKTPYLAEVPMKFELPLITDKIADSYNAPFWVEASLPCLGCGTCAFSCPTCTCFDIQDENTPISGERLRNWDSCGFGLFTLHASGHNPREVQSQRWKHRIMHKFNYSNESMNKISCTGCGRCIRNCPAGLNIIETLEMIGEA